MNGEQEKLDRVAYGCSYLKLPVFLRGLRDSKTQRRGTRTAEPILTQHQNPSTLKPRTPPVVFLSEYNTVRSVVLYGSIGLKLPIRGRGCPVSIHATQVLDKTKVSALTSGRMLPGFEEAMFTSSADSAKKVQKSGTTM